MCENGELAIFIIYTVYIFSVSIQEQLHNTSVNPLVYILLSVLCLA